MMKTSMVVLFLGFVILAANAADGPSCPPSQGSRPKCAPGDYCVNRAQMSGICIVEKATASKLGEYFCGPYRTKAEATTAMCSAYNPTASEAGGCEGVNPDDAC